MNLKHIILLSMALLVPMSAMAKRRDAEPPVDAFAQELLKNRDIPIILLSIKELKSQQWTQGNPPKPLIRVHGVIRGEKVPTNLTATWDALPPDFSWATPEEQSKLLAEWSAQTMQIPFQDSKWYAALNTQEGAYSITPVLRFPASSDIYRYISIEAGKHANEPPEKVSRVDELEEQAARHARMKPWLDGLKKVSVTKLKDDADIAALASITEMKAQERAVSFSITHMIKQPKDRVLTPEVITLAGFPDTLFAHLHDYRKLEDMTELMVFLKQGSVTNEQGQQVPVFRPVSGEKSILPATDDRLQELNIKITQ
ncbi:MAG: hypothetical protein AB7L92_00985 [Alphaproteobacteria bacterium]